jgi:peroxiredoxin
MMQLHQDYNKFLEKDTKIVVIGPEKAKKFENYWEENNLKFYGIPDEKKSILKLYEQEVNLLKLGRMPAQMLVDKEGILRYAHYGNSMKDIPENSEILELIDKLSKPI